MPDTLKHKVYAAQSWVTGQQQWTSVRDAAAFIRWCERHAGFRELYPDHEPVKIFKLRDPGAPQAFYRPATHGIYLPYWAQDATYIVHELTHAVLRPYHGHGAIYCRAFHELVRLLMSEAQAAQLAQGFAENGIKALAYDDRGRKVSSS